MSITAISIKGVNSVDNALTCKKGGYVALRHNWVRDTIYTKLLSSAKFNDVKIEPQLLDASNKWQKSFQCKVGMECMRESIL